MAKPRTKIADPEKGEVGTKALSDELRYRTLFELVPVAVYSTDAEGVIREFNHRAAELWGREPDRQGEKFCGSFKLFHADGTPMPHDECPMARVLHGEDLAPSECEIIVENADGSRRNVSVSPRVLKNERGEIVGAINCLYDITERKLTEGALQRSEERFRQFAENSADTLWILDAERQQLEYLSPAFERIWGETRARVMRNLDRWGELIHPEDRAETIATLPRLVAGETLSREYRIVRPDNRAVRWIRDVGFPIRDQEGRVTRVAGVAQDVTEDKKQAEALRGMQERFRLLVEGARDYAMFLLDRENVITFWSAGAERVFGWTQHEAIGQSGAMIFTPADRRKGEVEKEISTAVSEGRALDRRFHLRKDGSRFWADGVLMRLDDETGKLRGFAKVARDATDQRRVEDELLHARDEMEQRVVERTQELLAMNNELERTMSQRQQLERELLEISEREKRRIGEDLHDMVCQELTATALYLKSSAKKLAKESPAAAATLEESAQTVNRNVVIARELAGGLQAVELTASGLKNALRDLAAQASENTGIKCHFKAARGVRVPDDTVALHLYRIAQEAVANAVKHSGAKNILISLDRNATHTCVSVQDDGKGFVVKRRGKGLGLHMMRYRANSLGGELKVERRRTGGMDITCVIPTKA